MIKPVDFANYGRKFRSCFGIELQKFTDLRLLLIFNCVCFDTVKFGNWLDEQYPNESNVDGISYEDIVTRHFGEYAAKLIKEMI